MPAGLRRRDRRQDASTTSATPACSRDLALPKRRGAHRRRADVHRRPLHDGSLRRGRGRASSSSADQVIPCHYDTFPPIETDAQAFKSDVQSAGYARGRHPRAGRDPYAMTTAVVLIEAERDAMSTLGGALADLEGVAEAYSVTGEWDFVAIVRVPRHEELAEVVTGQPRQARRAWRGRRRWSPSRCSPSTTSRRCSRSGTEGRGRATARGAPPGASQLASQPVAR